MQSYRRTSFLPTHTKRLGDARKVWARSDFSLNVQCAVAGVLDLFIVLEVENDMSGIIGSLGLDITLRYFVQGTKHLRKI